MGFFQVKALAGQERGVAVQKLALQMQEKCRACSAAFLAKSLICGAAVQHGANGALCCVALENMECKVIIRLPTRFTFQTIG
jgi:hypothetical protein